MERIEGLRFRFTSSQSNQVLLSRFIPFGVIAAGDNRHRIGNVLSDYSDSTDQLGR